MPSSKNNIQININKYTPYVTLINSESDWIAMAWGIIRKRAHSRTELAHFNRITYLNLFKVHQLIQNGAQGREAAAKLVLCRQTGTPQVFTNKSICCFSYIMQEPCAQLSGLADCWEATFSLVGLHHPPPSLAPNYVENI